MLTEGDALTVGTHHVKVVRYLSEGGFSKIYEVTMDPKEGDSDIGCLKQVVVPDKNGLNILRKEVDVMKTLARARSIVKYYDSNAERLPDGTYQVLVLMELCPNKSLLDFMNDRIRQKLTEPEILKIVLDIATGVYEMHKVKLIHRDIKIENVLINAKNDFKLCDFGSVAAPTRPPQNPQEFQFLGNDILHHTTPQYRSPEMIDLYRGLPIDEKSDIWALGCFLYKLCYYTTPFEANGDIAILHASFQFPPAPLYSGDLKNLIIIMLQENPFYRPNIVQILMLVAKLMGTEFSALKVEDFYGGGEYNFQALHEMQREKHNQMLKQQQFYLEQQKQQQAFEASKQRQALSNSPSRTSLPQSSGENSVQAKEGTTPVSSTIMDQSSAADDTVCDERVAKALKGNKISLSTAGLDETTKDSDKTHMHSDQSSTESVDLDVDLPELDHIAERYPSLEDINPSVSDDGSNLRRSSSHKTRSSLESSGLEMLLEPAISHEATSLPAVEPVKSRTDLEQVEAWQSERKPKFDERAGKLADEIFAVGSEGPHRTKSQASRSSQRSGNLEVSNPSTPALSAKTSPYQMPTFDILQQNGASEHQGAGEALPSFELPKPRSGLSDATYQLERPDQNSFGQGLFHGNANGETGSAVGRYEGLPQDTNRSETRRGSSNPWGGAISSPKSDPSKMSTQEVDLSLQKTISNLNIDSNPIERGKSFQGDLIDLEGNFKVAGTKQAHQHISPEKMEPIGPSQAQKIVQDSLIDMGLDVGGASKPTFRKRLSEMKSQPSYFQEQVIDFASDDENHSSEMNRVAIRKSLRNSRKSSDHRRNETGNEGKKRLSFFGGSSVDKD